MVRSRATVEGSARVRVRVRVRVPVRIERLQVLPGHEAYAVGRLDHPPALRSGQPIEDLHDVSD